MTLLATIAFAAAAWMGADPLPILDAVDTELQEFTIEVTNRHHLPVVISGVRITGSRRVPAGRQRTLTARWEGRPFYIGVRVEGARSLDPRGGSTPGDITYYTEYMRAEPGSVMKLEIPSRLEGDPRFHRERP